MAFERLRAHSALVGAVAVLAVASVSLASLVVAQGRLARIDNGAAATSSATSSATRPVVAPPPSTGPSPTTAPPTTTTTSTTTVAGPPAGFATELFALMNADRAHRGLPPLTWDDRLSATAQRVADSMAASGLVSEQDVSPILALGYTRGAENVLTGPYSTTALAAQHGWMASAPHRAVILDAGFGSVGISATSSPDGRMWVAVDFGGLP